MNELRFKKFMTLVWLQLSEIGRVRSNWLSCGKWVYHYCYLHILDSVSNYFTLWFLFWNCHLWIDRHIPSRKLYLDILYHTVWSRKRCTDALNIMPVVNISNLVMLTFLLSRDSTMNAPKQVQMSQRILAVSPLNQASWMLYSVKMLHLFLIPHTKYSP